jgi:hypothetical protein
MEVVLMGSEAFGPWAEISLVVGISDVDIKVPGYHIEDDHVDEESGVTSPEGWEELLTEVVKVLAFFGLPGEVDVRTDGGVWGDVPLEEGDAKTASEAIRRLKERGALTITLEDVAAARGKALEEAESVDGGLKIIKNLVQEEGLKRGLNKEEREKMTLGEICLLIG